MQPLAARAQKEKALSKKLVGITQVDTKKRHGAQWEALWIYHHSCLYVCLPIRHGSVEGFWHVHLNSSCKVTLWTILIQSCLCDPMWSHVIPCDCMSTGGSGKKNWIWVWIESRGVCCEGPRISPFEAHPRSANAPSSGAALHPGNPILWPPAGSQKHHNFWSC